MRLVNIDECDKNLFYKQCGGKDNLITVETAFNMIQALPTAYDVDEIVEKLEEIRNRFNKLHLSGEVIGVVSAINVVKVR